MSKGGGSIPEREIAQWGEIPCFDFLSTEYLVEDMSEINEEAPARSKFWIWFLVVVLVCLLMVPVASIGLALKKTGWVPVASAKATNSSHATTSAPSASPTSTPQNDLFAPIREKIEKVASSVTKNPRWASKSHTNQTPAQSITKASDSVCAVLRDKKHQFVEAVSSDAIRIVVILPGNQWPDLSGSLQTAAENDGFLYRGPNQTSSGSGTDSMVAEIEILRRAGRGSKN